jgi:hypothetical protein
VSTKKENVALFERVNGWLSCTGRRAAPTARANRARWIRQELVLA